MKMRGTRTKKNLAPAPMCVTIPNLVALGQTILALAEGPKHFWRCWALPPWDCSMVIP